MTLSFWCVLLAAALVWASRLALVGALRRSGQRYDNNLPERQLAELDGLGARAAAAERNLARSFAPFAAAVIIAHLAGVDARRAAVLAIAFVVSQLVYLAAYLGNADYLRVFVWLLGVAATVGLFVLAGGGGV